MINAQIVADSLSPQGDRLISVLATFPRIILAEVNTHRMLSKNTASSRAIPFEKMVKAIQDNPFIPIAWQKEHKGMQGSEYAEYPDIEDFKMIWLEARDNAIKSAKLAQTGDTKLTKQLCNRLLEPFMWTTMLITGSKEGWDNFFELRCPDYVFHDEENRYDTHNEEGEYHFKSKKDAIKFFGENEPVEFSIGNINFKDLTQLDWLKLNKGMAEIHIMDLAEKIYDAFNESTPKQLQAGEWHVPFQDRIIMSVLDQHELYSKFPDIKSKEDLKVRISTAMAARTSYTVVGDEKEIDYKKMIELHDRLINQKPLHASPMEHCARAMSNEEYYEYFKGQCKDSAFYNGNGWCRNYKGFIQYRHILETQNQI